MSPVPSFAGFSGSTADNNLVLLRSRHSFLQGTASGARLWAACRAAASPCPAPGLPGLQCPGAAGIFLLCCTGRPTPALLWAAWRGFKTAQALPAVIETLASHVKPRTPVFVHPIPVFGKGPKAEFQNWLLEWSCLFVPKTRLSSFSGKQNKKKQNDTALFHLSSQRGLNWTLTMMWPRSRTGGVGGVFFVQRSAHCVKVSLKQPLSRQSSSSGSGFCWRVAQGLRCHACRKQGSAGTGIERR